MTRDCPTPDVMCLAVAPEHIGPRRLGLRAEKCTSGDGLTKPASAWVARAPVHNQLGNRVIRASVANRCLRGRQRLRCIFRTDAPRWPHRAAARHAPPQPAKPPRCRSAEVLWESDVADCTRSDHDSRNVRDVTFCRRVRRGRRDRSMDSLGRIVANDHAAERPRSSHVQCSARTATDSRSPFGCSEANLSLARMGAALVKRISMRSPRVKLTQLQLPKCHGVDRLRVLGTESCG